MATDKTPAKPRRRDEESSSVGRRRSILAVSAVQVYGAAVEVAGGSSRYTAMVAGALTVCRHQHV